MSLKIDSTQTRKTLKSACRSQCRSQGAFEYILLVAAAVFFVVALTLVVKQVIR